MAHEVDRVVMFCDCHNFSIVQTELTGRTLAFLDRFYQTCGECIVSAGGRLVKYLGDAVLSVFPEGGAADAVRAGICLRREYASLIAELGTSAETDMEVGISAGPVEEGEVGHRSLRTPDVFGECVNEAAMIGHHRGIAITEAVRKRLPPEFETRPVAPFPVKWRAEALAVYEVVTQ
jgi:adenylate cyclase